MMGCSKERKSEDVGCRRPVKVRVWGDAKLRRRRGRRGGQDGGGILVVVVAGKFVTYCMYLYVRR